MPWAATSVRAARARTTSTRAAPGQPNAPCQPAHPGGWRGRLARRRVPPNRSNSGFHMSILSDLSDSAAALAERTGARVLAIRHPEGGQSSAFIWRTGLAVMAEETLAGEEEVEAIFPDGRAVTARIAGRDPTSDVALLELETGTFADWSQSPLPRPGAFALVAGRSETSLIARLASIVSVGPEWQSRRGGKIDARITLDQRLSRMAEGGVVVAPDGSLIGMAVTAAGGRGIVIPASSMARSIATLGEKGYVPRPWLGVALHPLAEGQGAVVLSVELASPATAAGLLVGDIITTWDGEAALTVGGIAARIAGSSVGRSVKLGVSRGGNVSAFDIVIGERPRR